MLNKQVNTFEKPKLVELELEDIMAANELPAFADSDKEEDASSSISTDSDESMDNNPSAMTEEESKYGKMPSFRDILFKDQAKTTRGIYNYVNYYKRLILGCAICCLTISKHSSHRPFNLLETY